MILLRSIGASLLLMSAPAALAQQVAPRATQTTAFSEQQLRNFAKAVVELRALSDIYSPRLKAASLDNAKEIRAEAKTKAVAAMSKHQLTPDLYRLIQEAAQKDAALDKRITGYLDELTASTAK
jgi:hypothetical protein